MEDKMYLSDDQICEVIKSYVKEDIYPYAIMLDGEWGSGKSFFVEHKIKAMFKEGEKPEGTEEKFSIYGRHYLYVSLYGVSSTKELETRVTSAYFKMVMPKSGGFFKTLSAFGPTALEWLPYVAETFAGEKGKVTGQLIRDLGQNNKGSVETVQNALVSMEKCFIVFDDLERCCMPITEVFGYINQKVEHEKCKVLIVANEKECGKIIDQNNELKMVAAQILLNETTVNDEKGKIKVEDIKKFAEEQFGESSLYHRTREKLIGKTIRYQANLEETISLITNQVLEKNGVGKYEIKILINASLRAMRDANVYNLRIFQIALAAYMYFKDVIDEILADDDVRDEIIKDVMYAIVREEILENTTDKEKRKSISWNEGEHYQEVNYSPKPKDLHEAMRRKMFHPEDTFFTFRFLHEYVEHGIVNKKMAQEGLKKYAQRKQKEKQIRYSAFEKIRTKTFLNFSDYEYEELLKRMGEEIEEGQYPVELFLKIMRYSLAAYQNFEIGNPDDIKKKLIAQVKKERWSEYIEGDHFIQEHLKEKALEEYKQFEAEINALIQEHKVLEMKKEFNQYDIPEWSKHFHSIGSDQNFRNKIKNVGSVMKSIDIEGLLKAIQDGNSEDIMNVFFLFLGFYEDEAELFKEDWAELSDLISGLEKMRIDDKIKMGVREYAVNELKKYESRMK